MFNGLNDFAAPPHHHNGGGGFYPMPYPYAYPPWDYPPASEYYDAEKEAMKKEIQKLKDKTGLTGFNGLDDLGATPAELAQQLAQQQARTAATMQASAAAKAPSSNLIDQIIGGGDIVAKGTRIVVILGILAIAAPTIVSLIRGKS